MNQPKDYFWMCSTQPYQKNRFPITLYENNQATKACFDFNTFDELLDFIEQLDDEKNPEIYDEQR